MRDRKHGAATVTTRDAERKIFRASREFYLAVRGGLIARSSNITRWAEDRGYTRSRVEDACHGLSNSPEAKKIRAELAADLNLELEEDAAA